MERCWSVINTAVLKESKDDLKNIEEREKGMGIRMDKGKRCKYKSINKWVIKFICNKSAVLVIDLSTF